MRELERRGDRRLESGAFLLGQIEQDGRRRASQAIYYDDLEPTALYQGQVCMTPQGFSRLWEICEQTGKQVVADIHTHPGVAIQSFSDQQGPMIVYPGHLALIIPHFAKRPVKLSTVGLFEYCGSKQWKTLSDLSQPQSCLYVAPWA